MVDIGLMWNVVAPAPKKPGQEKDGKTRWVTIGVAFPGTKPGSIRVVLNALPIGNTIFLFEKEDKDDRRRPPANLEVKPGGADMDAMDDEIPF